MVRIFLLLIALSDIRFTFKEPVYEHADLIEMNHKYHESGKPAFTQVIFWERHPGNGKYRVRDWFLVDDREQLCGIPMKRSGIYESHFIKEGYYYIVRSPLYRESWTMYDPEAQDADKHPKNMRRLLRRPEERIPEELR
jgi:hypothetical protein